MVQYPEKFNYSTLNEYSIEELYELEDALFNDRNRVMAVLKVKKLQQEEE